MTVFGKRVIETLKVRPATIPELMALCNFPLSGVYKGISEARADGYVLHCKSLPGLPSEWRVVEQ